MNLHHLDLWGVCLLIVRFYDGYKYHIQTKKIKQLQSAKGHSRDFGNVALGIDLFMLLYFIVKNQDIYLIFSTIVIILFVTEYWITLYLYYPYKMRGCPNFKRPNVWHYFLNSIQSDKFRKRL